MNIFPLWCDRQARIKASFIQIRIVHTRPGRPLGFDINDVWNRGISHIRRSAISSMIWLSVKLFLLINNVSRLLLCWDLGNETSLIHKSTTQTCVSFKNLQKITTDFSVLVLQSYFICVLVSKREADLRWHSPSAPSCLSV